MSKEQIDQLTKAVEQATEGLVDLKKAQEQAKKDTDGLIQAKIDRIAEETAKSVQEMQERQAQVEAALKRPGIESEKGDESPETKAAFKKFLSGSGVDPADSERKYMSTDSNVGGGYLVPVQTLGIITGRVFETSPLRRIANIINTTSKSVSAVLDDGEAEAKWEGEGSRTQGDETATPNLGTVEITAHKLAAQPAQTMELIEDAAFDVESWLIAKLADAFARKENTGFLVGDGVRSPRGLLTYDAATPGTYQRNALEQVANGSSAPTVEGLIDLQGALKEPYQARAVFGMKRTTLVAYMKLKGTDMYRFLNLQPAVGPQGQVIGSNLTLMEKPVVLMDDMPVVAANALSVAYGDFSKGYTIVDRRGIAVLKDPYTAKGFMRYFTTKRVGGAVTNFEAIKLLKMA